MTNYRARYAQEEIIAKFIETHGTKYNYSRVCFTKCSSKVEIVCEQHGSFMQAPASHMRVLVVQSAGEISYQVYLEKLWKILLKKLIRDITISMTTLL